MLLQETSAVGKEEKENPVNNVSSEGRNENYIGMKSKNVDYWKAVGLNKKQERWWKKRLRLEIKSRTVTLRKRFRLEYKTGTLIKKRLWLEIGSVSNGD